jgi:predicted transcriptional regulator
MMATTLKLPPELKDRISKVVEGTGQTAHAFMVDAIRTQTDNAERHRSFTAAALEAREEFARTGTAYAMEEVHAYINARAAGKKVRKPKPKRCRA